MSKLAPADYAALLTEIKGCVRSAQYQALRTVNKELIGLYWDIGRMIAARQEGRAWGKSVVERLARDLQAGAGCLSQGLPVVEGGRPLREGRGRSGWPSKRKPCPPMPPG